MRIIDFSMARASACIVSFLRQCHRNTRQNPNTQLRKFTMESKETEFNGEENKQYHNEGMSQSLGQDFLEIAEEVSKIIRTKSEWEQTLLSDFPSFNFADPKFFSEVLKHQNNALLSLNFYNWLHSNYNFVPDQVSSSVLFHALLDSKASNAAKCFLDQTGFCPEPGTLERYMRCLFEGGLIEAAFDVFMKFEGMGVCPSISTWNSAMLGCLKVGKTDHVWRLYNCMVESGVVADADAETVECLIQAFCSEGKLSEGYEILRQVLKDGLRIGNVAFNKLIAGFCKQGNYGMVSELLHTMIATNHYPDIYTYQEVINGLCKSGRLLEALKVFNDIKERGYAPDGVMYTTIIYALCEKGQIDEAKKIWHEMINNGILPNEYAYNALMHAFCRTGCFEEARELHKDVCDKGYQETTESYNVLISELCLHGRANEASELYEEMTRKGLVPNVFTYEALIQVFCRIGMIDKSKILFEELLAQGLQASASSYTLLIEKLCEGGHVKEAKKLWNDMKVKGLEPIAYGNNHFISVLCNQGLITEAMDLLLRC